MWQQCQSDADLVIGSLPGGIRSLEASSDGRFLAAGSEFGAVKVWDLSTRQAIDLTPESGVQSFLAFSPDAHCLAFTDQSLDRPGTIGLWDTRAQQRLAPIVDPVMSARWASRRTADGSPSGSCCLMRAKARWSWTLPPGSRCGSGSAKTQSWTPTKVTRSSLHPTVSRSSGFRADGRIMRWNFMAGSEAGILHRAPGRCNRDGHLARWPNPRDRRRILGNGHQALGVSFVPSAGCAHQSPRLDLGPEVLARRPDPGFEQRRPDDPALGPGHDGGEGRLARPSPRGAAHLLFGGRSEAVQRRPGWDGLSLAGPGPGGQDGR